MAVTVGPVELPVVMGPTGPIPTPPATIRAALDTDVKSTNPDYTSNLPGSLVEDILSTDVAACVESDQFFIDLINSVTPYGSNLYLLTLLGQIYGIQQGQATNTSVYVVFNAVSAADGSTPVPGVVVGQGFIVSDNTYQYICPEGGITGVDGNTLPIYAVATTTGSWAIPQNTVNQLISASPFPLEQVTLTVTNPEVGTPASAAETATQYRSRVLTAGLAASTGMSRYLKTLLGNIPGVQTRLVSIQQDLINQGWNILVGGGDPYQVAYAIWQALFDTSTILSGAMGIADISNSNPCKITTGVRHYLTTGMVETITNAQGLTELNGHSYTVTVVDAWNFTVPVDTSALALYTGGGFVSPNPNTIPITINDFPDRYLVYFINPPQQQVSLTITWNTNSPFYVSPAAVAQLGNPAVVGYINGLNAGTDPINIVNLQGIFVMAVSSILPPQFIDVLTVQVSIDGIGVVPETGTNVIYGDQFSYFYTTPASVVIQQSP